ncbi:FG-GAP-like repeat-containing protein [Dyadobacter psychrophilus]|uniref:Por secretion system C-terminal sorting domain-containing protein n=1 Tax=Dyadobacter psychrophilus TaxID=651661 RepID=A0A1T5H2R4_9BACT|nr:FG-GAP-like repeat-containing protein [Dyadobacter psychrophilus]SKC14983.1 Por secretion system C-terminal sorting domain-containing protein [Dyadobacter psychrophilus]
MRKKYLGSTFFVLLVACSAMRYYHFRTADSPHKPKLLEAQRSAGKSKQGKLSENGNVPDSTLATIYSSIAAREYHVTKDPVSGIPQSPNRKQNLRAYFKPGLFTIKNRVDSAGHDFRLTLKLDGLYADSRKLAISSEDTATVITENKIQLRQGILTEEYINTEAGVRQNFIVQNAPGGTDELAVKLAAEGLIVKQLPNNKLEFYANEKNDDAPKLTYDGLKCWDANGKDLPATLSYKDGLVQIAVNTKSAAYPVTIDPLVSSGNPGNANALLVGKQLGAQAGSSVASAGDVNGDGYSDVIVGAPLYDANKPNQGAFFVYLGSSIGITVNNGITYTGDSNVGNAYFGSSLSSAGDVNGDGFSDVIVGSWGYSNSETEEGAAYIYYGSAFGLNLTSVKIESNQATASFGQSVAGAGDINGDGFSDVVVGAPSFTHGEQNEGAALIFMGSQSGISSTPSDTLESNQASSYYGQSVACAGDVNGDGFSDLIVGAYFYDNLFSPNLGAAFIYSGASSGIVHSPAMTLFGQQEGSKFGYSVSSAGDLNGDGYSDVIIGSPNYANGQNQEGAVSIHLASSQGIGIQNQAKTLMEGGQAGGAFGSSVACAGDVNGDGFSDVIVGEPGRDNAGNVQEGWAHVYFGSITGSLPAKSFVTSSQAEAELGTSVASAGDVNGDGFSDIIVGAPSYNQVTNDDGIALVFHGSAASVETNFSVQIIANQAGADLGYSVSGAGDVNGDGYDDVIVGAPFYDNGANDEGAAFLYRSDGMGVDLSTMLIISMGQALANFGHSVAAAGDVNSDGYGDVIIGAPLYDLKGVTDCGAGFIYYGSPNGLSVAITNIQYNLTQGARVGWSVSGAGDLNADGFDDIVIGVPSYGTYLKPNVGAFMASYGSKTGIKNGVAYFQLGSQFGSEFGSAVSSAGDINGDGYDDVIIGSFKFNGSANTQEEGAAFVYYGGEDGLGNSGTILDLNKTKALMGWDVAGAGDINGDGFSDVIVGLKNNSNGEANEGAVAIYYGASLGIQKLTPTIIESNQADALMGASVGSADVNGDGYNDILVGSPAYTDDQGKEGAVLVYHGSENGVITSVAAIIGGNHINSGMGYSVSSAGDVNADGIEDVIAGANQFSGTGRAFIYHGNGDGISVNNDRAVRGNLNLYNSDLSTSISKDNLGKDDFGVGLYAKSFLGRNKGKVVWEIIGQGQSFSHASPITNSTQSTGQGNLTDLLTTEVELKSLVDKTDFLNKIRARVRFSPVLAITGQVYGPWRYADAPILADPSTLPVELVRFEAKANEKQVDLTWETASEMNSDYFELQRSNDAKAWEKIGSVYSAGDSKKANSYSFIDFKPQTGANYYRLKMIDKDKTFAYSSIKSVKFEGKPTGLFPNPVTNTLNIDSETLNTEISIYDVSGNEVLRKADENGIKTMDVSPLIPGNYLIKLKDKSFHIIKK